MSKDNKKRPRKTRDISTELEEDNLWDLEDDWDDESTEPAESPTGEQEEQASEAPEEEKATEPTSNELDTVEDEKASEVETQEDEVFGLDDELVDDNDDSLLERDDFEELEPLPESDAAPGEDIAESEEEPIAEPSPEPIPAEQTPEPAELETEPEDDEQAEAIVAEEAAASPETAAVIERNLSLKPVEKISLIALAACLLGLAVWGCFWLADKNKIANRLEMVALPKEGQHATVTDLITFWITPESETGVNMNAVIVPAISITLDDSLSQSGALRLYFRNADKDSVGDTITLKFENGKFPNGSNTIEVAASDGFHTEGQFHAYQVDNITPWRVVILEAPDVNSPGSDFKEFIDAPVEAKRK